MLVNAHTHLELSSLAARRQSMPDALPAWLASIGSELRRRDRAWFERSCEEGIELLHRAGTTQVGDVTWTGESVAPLARSGLGGVAWVELRGLLPEQGRRRLVDVRRLVDRLGDVAARGAIHVGVEIHSPYTLHPSLWEPVLRWVEGDRLSLAIHVAESPDEWELFVHGRGGLGMYETMMSLSALPAFLRYPVARFTARARALCAAFGYPYPLSTGVTPIQYLERQGVLGLRPLLVHAVEVNTEDVDRIRRSGAAVVHCPRSNRNLGCRRMPLEQYLKEGIRVLLGTDSLASAQTLDVRDEVIAAIELHRGRVEPEAIEALVTQSGILGPGATCSAS